MTCALKMFRSRNFVKRESSALKIPGGMTDEYWRSLLYPRTLFLKRFNALDLRLVEQMVSNHFF